MKQVKVWQYALILYGVLFTICLLRTVIAVAGGRQSLPFGWGAEIFVAMFTAALDMIIAFPVSLGIDALLRRFMQKTLLPTLTITVCLYLACSYLLSMICA